jgi:hypothetical protein
MPPYAVKCLVEQATPLYARYCMRHGFVCDQPSGYASDVEEVDNVQYVGLRNGPGLLAAYRIHRETKRLRFVAPEKWPAEIIGIA